MLGALILLLAALVLWRCMVIAVRWYRRVSAELDECERQLLAAFSSQAPAPSVAEAPEGQGGAHGQ